MIYRWFLSDIKDIIGNIAAEITVGGIPTGEFKEVTNEDGSTDKVPVKKSGVEIRTQNTLTISKLAELDQYLVGHKRVTIPQEVK